MLLNEFKPTYFNVREEGDVVVGQFCVPRLTEDQNVEQLGHDLFALVEHFAKRKVVLSLASVEFMTSSVLGKLITLHRKLHRCQGKMVLFGLSDGVDAILRTSKLLTYFAVAENRDAAIAQLAS